MSKRLWAYLLPLALSGGAALGQERAERPAKPATPLKVQVTFARYQAEKKVSNMPYTLLVNADDRARAGLAAHGATSVRMGIQVPLVAVVKEQPTVTYRDVGTNLDCSAESLEDGRFKLILTLEQMWVSSAEVDRKSTAGMMGEAAVVNSPFLRVFRSNTNMILRDGQTGQYVAATDPVSGEVLKIDVTLNVLK